VNQWFGVFVGIAMIQKNIDVIEIMWSGPFSPEWVIEHAIHGSDHGIYQIYGTHAVGGPDTLLYTGKAQESTFSARIRSHRDSWTFQWEPDTVVVYLGRCGSTVKMTPEQWPQWNAEIERAEKLLIGQTTPPYNGISLNDPGVTAPTLIVNYKQRHRLPVAVTSLIYTTAAGTEAWNIYGEEPL
jgi:hypothetical protein